MERGGQDRSAVVKESESSSQGPAHPKKTGTDERDPAVQDVLNIFPHGEVIE